MNLPVMTGWRVSTGTNLPESFTIWYAVVTPNPARLLYLKGEKTRFYGAKLMEETVDKTPGTILDIDDQGIHVAVSGGKTCCRQSQAG